MRELKDFCSLPRDSFTGRTSSCEKHLDKFFKFFFLSVLASGPVDLLTTWLSHEKHMFCVSRLVFKLFQFFPQTFLNSSCHSHKPPFLLHFNFKSSRKMYGFSLSHYIFLVLSIIFLNLWVVFSIGFLGVSVIGWIIFVEFECMSLVFYSFKMLHFSVIIIVFLFWAGYLLYTVWCYAFHACCNLSQWQLLLCFWGFHRLHCA